MSDVPKVAQRQREDTMGRYRADRRYEDFWTVTGLESQHLTEAEARIIAFALNAVADGWDLYAADNRSGASPDAVRAYIRRSGAAPDFGVVLNWRLWWLRLRWAARGRYERDRDEGRA